jgi:hypothetical protein
MIESEFGIFIQKDVIVLGLEKMKKGRNKLLLKQFPNEFEIESRNTYVKSSNCSFSTLFKALPTKLVKCELCPGKQFEEDKLNGHLVSQHFEEVTIIHKFLSKYLVIC